MSNIEEQNQKKKKSHFGIFCIIFILLIIVLGIGIVSSVDGNKSSNHGDVKVEQKVVASGVSDKNIAIKARADNETTKQKLAEKSVEKGDVVVFDLENAAIPRILGNPNAPVKISEHSSFTCGHCAKFHKTNFKQIKKDYVDTGKAYIVYSDFPLNGHDIKIGSIARCVPEKSFFSFIQLLFETQENWLKKDYLEHVKQNAKLTGVSEEQINECLSSRTLHEALANGREKAMNEHGVNSTPTLVINDSAVIAGLAAYSEIKKILDAELEKQKNITE